MRIKGKLNMNAFPEKFNPTSLRKDSEEFQKQAQELRTQILRKMNPLTGHCEIQIDSYGPAVIRLVKNELTSRGFVVNELRKERTQNYEVWLSVDSD